MSHRVTLLMTLGLTASVLIKAQTVTPKRACAELLKFDALAVEFSKAEVVPASAALPAYCLVQGTINKRIGDGGQHSESVLNCAYRIPGRSAFCFRAAAGWTAWCGPLPVPYHLGIHGRAGTGARVCGGIHGLRASGERRAICSALRFLIRQRSAGARGSSLRRIHRRDGTGAKNDCELLRTSLEEVLLHGLFQRRTPGTARRAALSA